MSRQNRNAEDTSSIRMADGPELRGAAGRTTSSPVLSEPSTSESFPSFPSLPLPSESPVFSPSPSPVPSPSPGSSIRGTDPNFGYPSFSYSIYYIGEGGWDFYEVWGIL
ncbi:MAG: hypothetical protein LBV13_04940, partial [Methanomassiliicoccaceae archaeon]|nr:hypothetical protein [Methanomassiliicoccaceae archaeon]